MYHNSVLGGWQHLNSWWQVKCHLSEMNDSSRSLLQSYVTSRFVAGSLSLTSTVRSSRLRRASAFPGEGLNVHKTRTGRPSGRTHHQSVTGSPASPRSPKRRGCVDASRLTRAILLLISHLMRTALLAITKFHPRAAFWVWRSLFTEREIKVRGK